MSQDPPLRRDLGDQELCERLAVPRLSAVMLLGPVLEDRQLRALDLVQDLSFNPDIFQVRPANRHGSFVLDCKDPLQLDLASNRRLVRSTPKTNHITTPETAQAEVVTEIRRLRLQPHAHPTTTLGILLPNTEVHHLHKHPFG